MSSLCGCGTFTVREFSCQTSKLRHVWSCCTAFGKKQLRHGVTYPAVWFKFWMPVLHAVPQEGNTEEREAEVRARQQLVISITPSDWRVSLATSSLLTITGFGAGRQAIFCRAFQDSSSLHPPPYTHTSLFCHNFQTTSCYQLLQY